MGRSNEMYQEMVDQKDYVDEHDLWEITNLYIKLTKQLGKHKDELQGTPHQVLIDLVLNEVDERVINQHWDVAEQWMKEEWKK